MALNRLFPPSSNATSACVSVSQFGEAKMDTNLLGNKWCSAVVLSCFSNPMGKKLWSFVFVSCITVALNIMYIHSSHSNFFCLILWEMPFRCHLCCRLCWLPHIFGSAGWWEKVRDHSHPKETHTPAPPSFTALFVFTVCEYGCLCACAGLSPPCCANFCFFLY